MPLNVARHFDDLLLERPHPVLKEFQFLSRIHPRDVWRLGVTERCGQPTPKPLVPEAIFDKKNAVKTA